MSHTPVHACVHTYVHTFIHTLFGAVAELGARCQVQGPDCWGHAEVQVRGGAISRFFILLLGAWWTQAVLKRGPCTSCPGPAPLACKPWAAKYKSQSAVGIEA